MYTPVQIGTPTSSGSNRSRQQRSGSNNQNTLFGSNSSNQDTGRSQSNPNSANRNGSSHNNSNMSSGPSGFSSLLTSFGIRHNSNNNSNNASTNTVNNNNMSNSNQGTVNPTTSSSNVVTQTAGNARRLTGDLNNGRSRTASNEGTSITLTSRQQQHQQQVQLQRQIQNNMSNNNVASSLRTRNHDNCHLPISLSLSSQREQAQDATNANLDGHPETESSNNAEDNMIIDLTEPANEDSIQGPGNNNNPFFQHSNDSARHDTNVESTSNSFQNMRNTVHNGEQNASLNVNTSINNHNKNLRHYVYGADQVNADELLNLQLPTDKPGPEAVDEETVRKRKDKNGFFSLRLTPFVDSSSGTNQGLFFEPVIRKAGPGSQLVIGRYTERVHEAISKIPEQYHPVVFKSKVVSRTHGCFKVDSQGNWFIQDIKSSSGTFLNHQRLSQASTLSKDVLLHDGDILQLGMDFRGGTEEIYRCVRMRVELNRSWKLKANAFNKEALQKMRKLQKMTTGSDEEDCSICLSKIKPCQAIFISPCAHTWHFRCVRRLVMLAYPQFVCPNCRSTCDLEASLDNSDSESESDLDSEGDELVDQLNGLLDQQKDISIT
ncbi:Zinc finger RING-type profile [Nakaseomyces glabratus]|nr:Zinc finger RING-type profile [Nakaseomyces glabratus]